MLKFYNTLTHQKEDFFPLDLTNIRMYVCGPTVYDFAHLGNARCYVVFDILFRLLRHTYENVTYVRNITDVDDKIIHASHCSGKSIAEITKSTTKTFHEDMNTLGNLSPTHEPMATQHIPHMIQMIQKLIEKEHAYAHQGHVLFHVKSDPHYGELSRQSLDEMIAGARVEIAPYKKDPRDFVLWKPSFDNTPGWESPWGFGRPGWHIECSAMSREYLGETFDIHAGGQDLIFPHHENEQAQSTCYHNKPFVRYWMHNGYLTVNGEKMSKSLGNFLTARDLLKTTPAEVIRYALLSTHYRQPLDWTPCGLLQAQNSLNRLYLALRSIEIEPTQKTSSSPNDLFLNALGDDLNTPLALCILHDLATSLNKASSPIEKRLIAQELKQSGKFIGILTQDPEIWFQASSTNNHDIDPLHIECQIEARIQARLSKNYAESDRIRDHLLQTGIILEDGPSGTKWRRI